MSLSTPIRVLVADDHPVDREGLIALINRSDNMQVVAEAANGQEAVRRFTEMQSHVTLIDPRMPVMDGFAAIAAIREISPQAGIIVLTNYGGDHDIVRGLRAGARAYLLKDEHQSNLLETIRQVARGEIYFPPNVAAILAQ